MRQIDAKGGITPAQDKFIVALLQYPTVKAAAEHVGIAERTARSYMAQSNVKAAYEKLKQEMLSDALNTVQIEAVKSIQVIVEMRDDTETPAPTRLKAAHILASRLTDVKPDEPAPSGLQGMLVDQDTLQYITDEELTQITNIVEGAKVRRAQAEQDQRLFEEERR